MDAESTNKQEQLHIKDNTTLQGEKSDNGVLCKVDSHSDILSKPAENIIKVISPSMQTGSGSCDDDVSCRSNKQFSEGSHKLMTIDIDSKAAGAAEVKSQSVLELSDDYLTQMMKNNNDREIALYEGAFLVSDATECSEVHSEHAEEERNLLPVQGFVVTDVSNGAENKAIFDQIEMVENNENSTRHADVKEELVTIDDAHAVEKVDNDGKIDKFDTSRQDLLPNTEFLISDATSSFNDPKATEKDLTLDRVEVVDEKNNGNMETSDLKEKAMSTDNAFDEEVDSSENIHKIDTSRQDSLPNTELLIANETNSFNDTKETEKDAILDEIVMVHEKNNHNMETSDLKEKSLSTDNALDQQVDMKKYVDESITNKRDFLSTGEHFMVDKSNSSSDMKKSKNEFCRENINKMKSTAADVSDGKMSLVMLENVDVIKGFSRHELKDVNPTDESSAIIAKMRNMDWLKNLGGSMEGNRRKVSRKPSIDTEDIQKDVKDVKEEPTEAAKMSSKSAKKRSSHSKNRKARAVDSPKQDTSEDQNKKSSSDVRSANISKNETSKSANVRAVEKSKDTKCNPQILEMPRSSIGRGRSDRHKVSLGYSQPKAQSDTSDQWNKTPKFRLEIPAVEEKSYTKDKAHSSAESSTVEVGVEVKKLEHVTENVVVTNLSNSKKPEVCETEIESRLPDQPDDLVLSHNQSSVKSNENESSMQKNDEKIDMMKKHLPVVKNDEDSQNKSYKNLSSRPIYGRSTDESDPEKIPSLLVKGFGANANDFDKQEKCANKNTGCYNTSHEAPRWNYNNYSNRQNMNYFGVNAQQGFTSNRHRNITEEENKQNEESFTKNQMSTDQYQGSKGYSDKCYNNKTSGGRYNERNQDNRQLKYSDKNQDHRNYSEWNPTRNQEGKSYRDIVSDKNQSSQGDRYFLNQNNNGFGKGFSERFQDRACGERYSDKVRDSKNSTDSYPDRNQQSKPFRELSSDRRHDENQMVTKKQEPLNRNSFGFDRNNDSYQAKDKEFFNRHQINSGKYQDTRNSSNKNNDLYMCELHRKEQEILDTCKKQFLKTPAPEDNDQVKQNKSDVKSQKHYDNIQQAKVQKGIHQLQQSFSVPSVAHQSERSSSVDQNVKLHEKDEGLTNTQPIQSGDWTSFENTSKQDAVYSANFRCASPYTNINTSINATATNEYDSQYNESFLNSSNQFDSVSNVTASEQKINVVMPFEGNQNVQRAQGMVPGHLNQNQSSQVNTNDLFRTNANSPTPQQICTSANAAQFLETITSGLVDSTTTSTYPHSTMNVNAPPFEVTSNEKLNDQLMCMQYATLNSQAGLVNVDDECMLNTVLMNEFSHFNEEQLKLNQEIKELREKLAIKQAELMTSQVKMFNTAKATTKAFMKQSINPSLQQTSYSQLVQQQNQHLPSNYAQVKHPNVPPGFGDVSLNVQNTQINVSEVSTNVANVQNYSVEKLPSNSVPGPRMNVEPVYLAQSNMVYQQQTTNYQTYTDKTANSAAYNTVPQTAKQRQIRGGVIRFPKQ